MNISALSLGLSRKAIRTVGKPVILTGTASRCVVTLRITLIHVLGIR